MQALPKRAALLVQRVRCGRETCRCAAGALHGPYHYLFFREGGRLRKRYVRRAEVAKVRAQLKEAREERDLLRRREAEGRDAWRALRASVREAERHA